MDRVKQIFNVLSGRANPEEIAALQRWLNESEANREEYENIKLLWVNTIATNSKKQVNDSGFERLRRRMRAHTVRARRIKVTAVAVFFSISAFFAGYFPGTFQSGRSPRAWQFNQAKLVEVIPRLEKAFNISILVGHESLLECRVTATLVEVKDVREAVSSIARSLNLHCAEKGDGIFELKGNGCVDEHSVL